MRFVLLIATLGGLLSVILGAFAAHGLKHSLDERLIQVFQTGVQYQMYHSLVLLVVALLWRLQPSIWLRLSAVALSLGMILFCGSLYGLALTQFSWLGPVTPIGGGCFILGWLFLGVYALKEKNAWQV